MSERIIVVGAGLAGLCCARRLAEADLAVLVLEASDDVGGRVRTDEVEGFRLDRGFQVLQTAYPEARAVLDYGALALRPFAAGARVRVAGRFVTLMDPWRHPLAAVPGLFAPVGTLADKIRVARLRAAVRGRTGEHRNAAADRTTLEELRALGFSDGMIDRWFRPWFGGVFLERDLATSAAFFRFTFGMFAEGPSAVPARGMGEIPRQIAAGLPEGSVRTGARVASVDSDRVTLDTGETHEATAVVIAVEGPEVARLSNGEVDFGPSHATACLYFAADRPPFSDRLLVLDGEGGGPVNNLVVPSNVSPACAPGGRALVSASTVGIPGGDDATLERAVRDQLRGWFGATVDGWTHLRTYRIEHALPAQSPGSLGRGPAETSTGVVVCGDHREAASIQGAMTSGRRAAEIVLRRLGLA